MGLCIETKQKLENFPPQSIFDHMSTVEMERYRDLLQVLGTCNPCTAYCGISAIKKQPGPCQSLTLVTFTCNLWRIPHLRLLPELKQN